MMTFNSGYSSAALGLIALMLAGCAGDKGSSEAETSAQTAEAQQTTLSAESLKMAETAWLSISSQGKVFTTYLDSNGRYRDLHEGKIRYAGTWEQNDNQELCFTPDNGPVACWSHQLPRLDGVMRATNAAGRAIEVRKVIYEPPAPPLPESAEAAEPAAAEPQDTAATASRG